MFRCDFCFTLGISLLAFQSNVWFLPRYPVSARDQKRWNDLVGDSTGWERFLFQGARWSILGCGPLRTLGDYYLCRGIPFRRLPGSLTTPLGVGWVSTTCHFRAGGVRMLWEGRPTRPMWPMERTIWHLWGCQVFTVGRRLWDRDQRPTGDLQWYTGTALGLRCGVPPFRQRGSRVSKFRTK